MDWGILLNVKKFLFLIITARGVEEVLIYFPLLFILDKIVLCDKSELNPFSLMIGLMGILFNIYIYVYHLPFCIFLFLPLLIGFEFF